MTIPVATMLQEIRRLVQFSNQSNIDNATILQYLNLTWQYTIPQTFGDLAFKGTSYFMTQTGQPNYLLPLETQLVITGSVFCDGLMIGYTQDPNYFLYAYGNTRTNAPFILGNGTAGPYAAQFPSYPLIPGFTNALGVLTGSFVITTYSTNGAFLQVYDDGAGNLIGDGTGKISYLTGQVTELVFTSPVPSNLPISGDGNYYSLGQPTMVLFNENVFSLRPIPQKSYYMSYNYYIIPAALTEDGTLPLTRYFDLLTIRTALKIAEILKDVEQERNLSMQYQRALLEVTKTNSRQRNNTRPSTQFYSTPTMYSNLIAAQNPAPTY